MGLFQKIFNLVKEELSDALDEPKKGASKKKSSESKQQENETFEQVCAKAKSGDLAALYQLSDKYLGLEDYRETLEALLTELMNNGNVEGKALLAILIVKFPHIYPKEKIQWANNIADEAYKEGSIFIPFFNGIYFAHLRGYRRDWDPDVDDNRFLITPVNIQVATDLLTRVKEKIKTYSKDIQSVFHLTYGFLSWCLLHMNQKEEANSCALRGLEYKDPLSCYVLAILCINGWGGNDENHNYIQLYLKKAEQYGIEAVGEDFSLHFHHSMWTYYLGEYQRTPSEESAKMIKKHLIISAELGSSHSMANLAKFYETGASKIGISQDMEKALEWRNKAIAAGVNIQNGMAAFGSI